MKIEEYISSGIVELYVMGLCSEEEKQEINSLRKQNPVLEKAIRDFESVLEAKMQQNISLPDADTDKKILATLDALNTKISLPTAGKKNGKHIRIRSLIAAAAVVFIIAGGYIIFALNNKIKKLEKGQVGVNNTSPTLPEDDYKIMLDPKITPVAMYGVGTHAICRCTMFWDKKTGKMYIIIHHLPLSSSKKDYQLWAMVDGKPVSVGIVQDEIRGRFIEMQGVPGGATSFIVTLEKAGGEQYPTVDETYLSGRI